MKEEIKEMAKMFAVISIGMGILLLLCPLVTIPFEIASCKQKAKAYNLEYSWKFPAGCLNKATKNSDTDSLKYFKLDLEEK